MSDDTQTRKTPEATLREGALKATIWRNDGEKGPNRITEYTRSYQDKDGAWHDTHTMRESDHLKLSHLAGRAHDRVMELRIAEREQRKSKRQDRDHDQERDRGHER